MGSRWYWAVVRVIWVLWFFLGYALIRYHYELSLEIIISRSPDTVQGSVPSLSVALEVPADVSLLDRFDRERLWRRSIWTILPGYRRCWTSRAETVAFRWWRREWWPPYPTPFGARRSRSLPMEKFTQDKSPDKLLANESYWTRTVVSAAS